MRINQPRALRAIATIAALAAVVVGCTPARPAATATQPEAAAPQVSQARVLHILIRDEPAILNVRLDRNGAGFPLTVPLLYSDEKGDLKGLLAERAPNQADGSWVINADGTMRTTYTLKPDLKWQDGKPHTAADFVFTWQVFTDREVPVTTRTPESLMSDVTAEQAPTPANRFTGKNRGTYLNPTLDDMFNRYLKTVDENARNNTFVDMQKMYAEDVAQGPLFYLPQVAAMRSGLTGIKAPPSGSYLWNLWEWGWS